MIKKYKKDFFCKMKTIELIFKLDNVLKNKKNEPEESDKDENYLSIKNQKNNKNRMNAKIYSKKRLYNKNIFKKRVIVNNKNIYKIFEDRIRKLRFNLINHYLINKKINS